MKRNFHSRTNKVVYGIYSFLFLGLIVFTLGFFLLIVFDSSGHLDWSDYWGVAKFILLGMIILLLVNLVIRKMHNRSG